MADVKGIMMGGAGHDAAAIVAAVAVRAGMVALEPAAILAAYEWWRDAILASNEAAQSAHRDGDLPDDCGSVVVHLKAAEGKTVREVYEADKVGVGSGAEYLTWIVANLSDSKPALAAAVRRFLKERASE